MLEDAAQRLLSKFELKLKFEFDREDVEFSQEDISISDSDHASSFDTKISRQLGFLGRKKRYNDFRIVEADALMSWPNEYVSETGILCETEATQENLKRFINATKQNAHKWFLNLCASVSEAEELQSWLLLGDPGTGKSTLLKYLIQKLRSETSEQGVLFSRFECHKYLNKFYSISRANPDVDLAAAKGSGLIFVAYLHAMALRDVITNDSTTVTADGKIVVDNRDPRFGSPGAIQRFIVSALGDQKISSQEEMLAEDLVRKACLGDKFEPSHLESIPLKALTYLTRKAIGDRKIVFVFDGLDHLQPYDEGIEEKKYLLFLILMSQFNPQAELDTVNLKQLMPFIGGQIIAQRHRTYEHWQRQIQIDGLTPGDVLSQRPHKAFVCAASADAILFRAIPDEGSLYKLRMSRPRVFKAIRNVLACVTDVLQCTDLKRSVNGRQSLVEIFDGNMRDEFEYIRRVLVWASGDLIQADDPTNDLKDFIQVLEETDIRREFDRKRYRLIELLLRSDYPIFQNLVHLSGVPISMENGKRIHPKMSRNQNHTGLVDNIFNYSVAFPHGGNCENHCLLMKIRILQFLSTIEDDEFVTGNEIAEFLTGFSYSADSLRNLEQAITILRYGTLVREEPQFLSQRSASGFLDRRYQITERGKYAVNVLLFNTGYLEHCFHFTLLPRAILPRGNSTPRDHKIFNWSVNSIAHYFVLYQYIQFAESNTRSEVLGKFGITSRLKLAMVSAVNDMCNVDAKIKSRTSPTLAEQALTRIDEIVDLWKQQRLITNIEPSRQR